MTTPTPGGLRWQDETAADLLASARRIIEQDCPCPDEPHQNALHDLANDAARILAAAEMPAVRLSGAEREQIENAWIVSPQDGPAGDDDPMYRAVERIIHARLAALSPRHGRPMNTEWPACATYPNLGCVCRGAFMSNPSSSTCLRERTGDLTPIKTAEELHAAASTETPGGGGLTEAEQSYARVDPSIQWRGRWYSEASVKRILADRDAAAVQARAEVVARVEALQAENDEDRYLPGFHYKAQMIQRVLDELAALAGPNPRGGQDGGGE